MEMHRLIATNVTHWILFYKSYASNTISSNNSKTISYSELTTYGVQSYVARINNPYTIEKIHIKYAG